MIKTLENKMKNSENSAKNIIYKILAKRASLANELKDAKDLVDLSIYKSSSTEVSMSVHLVCGARSVEINAIDTYALLGYVADQITKLSSEIKHIDTQLEAIVNIGSPKNKVHTNEK